MQSGTALAAAFMTMTVALAGCTGGGGGGPLAIEVEEAANPVTEAFHFQAKGGAGTITWDFGDGTGLHEGREIEHTFGFTDGKITVRATATDGELTEVATTQLSLGSGKNAIPTIGMEATTDWVLPGEPVRLTGASSTDPDNDPLLYRFICTALGDPIPFIDDGHVHGPGAGVPFGVNVLATLNPDAPAAERVVEGDLCEALSFENSVDFTRLAGVEGAFTTPGVYQIDMEMRDPKSASLVGRFTIFVTPTIPGPTETVAFAGSLALGNSGAVQDLDGQTLNTGQIWDQKVETFSLQLPNLASTIRMAVSDPVGIGSVSYEITRGGAVIIPTTSAEELDIDPLLFKNGRTYTVTFNLRQGALVDYDWTFDVTHDVSPYYVHEAPPS